MPQITFKLPGGFNVDVSDTPTDGQVLTFNSTVSLWEAQTNPGGGEANTSSNAGAGEGLALAKAGVDLPFKSLIGDTEIVLIGNANDITFSIAAALARIATAQTWTQLQTFNAGISLNATGKLGLDGLAAPNTSIRERVADTITMEAGGRDMLEVNNTVTTLKSSVTANEGGELVLEGEGANVDWNFDNFTGRLRLFESGVTHFDLSSTVLQLPDIDLDLNGNNLTDAGTLSADLVDILGGIQHAVLSKVFEDFFCGDSLDVIWTFTDGQGTGSVALTDGISEGARITTGTSNNDFSSINFNNIRNFDPALCTVWGIAAFDDSFNVTRCGLSNGTNFNTAGNHLVTIEFNTGETNIQLYSSDGTTATRSASDVSLGTGNVPFKIVCNGTDLRLYLLVSNIWNLKVTKTTNRPTAASQPGFEVVTLTTLAAVGDLMYLRIQND